jgi:hypothetical protein
MPEDKPEPAAPTEAPRPTSPSPAGTRNGEELLAKYKRVGEDHPSYRKLKEALVRGQSAGVGEAVAELEAVKKVSESPAAVPSKPKAPRFWLWICLWGILLAVALYALAQRYVTAHIQEIIARNSPESPVEIVTSEAIGGQKSAEITARLLKEVDDLKPDGCLFVGHQLAKKEIVEYLSALSQIATVKLVLGPDDTGKSQLADSRSPLREYQFTEVREAPMPIRSQVLFAFNNRAKTAVAFIGTYPYDLRDSARGEHALVVIHGFDQCSQLYSAYAPLLKSSTLKGYGR